MSQSIHHTISPSSTCEEPIFLDFSDEKEGVLQTTEFTLEDDQDDEPVSFGAPTGKFAPNSIELPFMDDQHPSKQQYYPPFFP